MASSAVLVSCRPAALHSVTPGGTSGRNSSYPAVSVCTTWELGHVRGPFSVLLGPCMYGRT